MPKTIRKYGDIGAGNDRNHHLAGRQMRSHFIKHTRKRLRFDRQKHEIGIGDYLCIRFDG